MDLLQADRGIIDQPESLPKVDHLSVAGENHQRGPLLIQILMHSIGEQIREEFGIDQTTKVDDVHVAEVRDRADVEDSHVSARRIMVVEPVRHLPVAVIDVIDAVAQTHAPTR
jgi:hypothetical protein